jgi:amidohydrolase
LVRFEQEGCRMSVMTIKNASGEQTNDWRQAVRPEVLQSRDELIGWRRDLHQNPELGFQEFRTSKLVAERLESWGLEVKTGIAQTGVVGLLEGGLPGPTLLLRADMDALPILEETGVEYASQHDGKMHACGHDGHTSILLMAAKLLAAKKGSIQGRIKFVFQPAEEGPGGAEPMVKAGVLQSPQVDFALGLHLWSPLPVGHVAVSGGPVMAAADTFSVRVFGKGGHAAAPHECIDSVLIAAQMITSLHSIASRYVDPFEPSVLSVTRINGGTADNVIPGEVVFGGTVRTVRPETRERLKVRMREMIEHTAKGFGAHVQFEYHEGYPPLINDEKVSKWVDAICRDQNPDAPSPPLSVVPQRTMGGEDMAYFLQEVPGCYFFVGSGNSQTACDYAHHHPRFNLDEDALLVGVELFLRLAEQAPNALSVG